MSFFKRRHVPDAKVGDELWFHCEYMKGPRSGKVFQVVKYYSMTLYLLEVETHIDPYLDLRSEFQVRKEP